jgi:glycerophosphoryl diester phosphodiesterase
MWVGRDVLRFILQICLLGLIAVNATATRITFGGVATNAVIPAEYGSRLSAPSVAAVEGNGWTPHIALQWAGSGGTKWDFYNDAEWAGVAQTDTPGSITLPREWRITFSPDNGFGVKVTRFVIDDYANYAAGHSITWELRTPTNVILFSGNVSVAANANLPVTTGMTAAVSHPLTLVIRQTAGAGDDLAIDDLEFEEALIPTVTWGTPDAVLTGTALSAAQLNATANVPGTFTYTPPAGTVLAAGSHTLGVSFAPTSDPANPLSASVSFRVKSTADPVITHPPTPSLRIGEAMTVTRLGLSADVQGTFTTSPPLGTAFANVGPQNVAVQFVPANPVFNSAGLDLVLQITPEGTLWNFANSADRFAASYGPSALAPYDPGATNWPATKLQFGTAGSFGLPLPAGGDPDVLRFTGLSGRQSLMLTTNEVANGVFADNGWISNYTLVFDLFLPSPTTQRLPLWNTNTTNSNAAEAELTGTSPPRLVLANQQYETVADGAWHRIAVVIRSSTAEGQAHLYVDGRFVGAFGSNDSVISGAYALEEVFHVLADNTAGGTGYLASLRFIPRNLDYGEIVSLGGVHADGAGTSGPSAAPFPYAPRRRPFIMAHRGDSAFAPEDTVPAITSAFDKGADACEIDIRLTADGHAVLMHDGTIDRTTNGSGSASSFTLAQLQTFDAGSWFAARFGGTRPPSLAEAMLAAKGRGTLYLDIKVSGMFSAIQQAINTSGFDPDDLLWWTYGESTITVAQIKSAYPNARIMWEDNTARNNWGTWTPAQKQDWIQQMKTKGIWGFDYGSNFGTISPAFIADLHDAGFFVSVYSLLSPESIHRATETAGVDGFETDIPGVAHAMLPAKNLTLDATPLGAQTVRLRWADPALPIVVRYDVFRRLVGTSSWNWVQQATLQNPSLLEYFDRTASPATRYEYLVIRHNGIQPIATTNGLFATTSATGTEFDASYAEWAEPSFSDPEVDADGDGQPNWMEFAFASPPLITNPEPILVLNPGNLDATLHRRHEGGLAWRFQTSTNLQTWNTLTEGVDYTATITPLSLDEETVTFHLITPPQSPKLFLRARTSRP